MKINQVFDELYDDYTAKIIRWVPHYQEMVQNLANYVPDDLEPRRILDLGCGNGNASHTLLQRFPNAHYHLVDASTEMIQGCRERFADRSQFSYDQCLFQDLELEDGAYDLIVACLSIHHLSQAEKPILFKKLKKCLAPGAYFLYSDLMIDKTAEDHAEHLAYWEAYAKARATSQEEWDFIMDHYQNYDYPSSLIRQKDWLQEAGFRPITPVFQIKWWTTLLSRV